MGQLEDLRLLVYVIEKGSISKAAERLNIAKSAVSRRLQLLEDRYGSRLINREPGVWNVTATGSELYQRALRVVGDFEDIESDFSQHASDLSGPLTVSVPREFGITFLQSALVTFAKSYPEIQLAIDFDDRPVDLGRENYDFAIRISQTIENGVVATKIGTSLHGIFASPAYLAVKGTPEKLSDLTSHSLLHFGPAKRATWTFQDPQGSPSMYEFVPSLNSNSGMFLLEATLHGRGIARLPDFIVGEAERTGDLVQLLPHLHVSDRGIYLVHEENRRLNKRMRLFSEEIQRACFSQFGKQATQF
jgi:DNA-binding transcriptional LysR family regulator